jgi:peptide deformylase
MSLLKIITVPNEILKRKAKPVTDFGKSFQQLVDDMIETVRDAPGVGLAGPQVGKLLRVIIVEYGDEDEEDEDAPPKLFIMTNPDVTRTSEETTIAMEGCLSIPGITGEVERPESITIKGQNRFGQVMKVKPKGWLARIFLHEIDHLNGKLFTDDDRAGDNVYQITDEEDEIEFDNPEVN